MGLLKFTSTISAVLNQTKQNVDLLGIGATYPIIQRCISVYGAARRSHYDALGISPAATQNDIKQAYYNLSKVYHPDRNEGSDTAAEKFRAITEAYEVLGNYRLRKLYDKGILHTAGRQYARQQDAVSKEAEEEEDDPQTRFYKKRMTRTHVPTASGRTPIYDFDEWSRNHYGASFNRKKKAEEKFRARAAQDELVNSTVIQGYVVYAMVGLGLMYVLILMQERSHDTPKPLPEKNGAEDEK